MSKPHGNSAPRCFGVPRRTLLQVGYSGLMGVGLSQVLGRRASAATPAKPKSLIIVFLTGACSHHDTFDMKPDAPAEIRGEFKPIATSIPGYHICEHLPKLAERAKKYAVVRSFSHGDNNHLMSTHHVLTGEKQPGGFFDKIASRTDWPCYSSVLAHVDPSSDGLPRGVNLPNYLVEGPLSWPGQHAGLLGATFDPWQIKADPSAADFRVDALSLSPGIDVNRLGGRQSLLRELRHQQENLAISASTLKLQSNQDAAYSLLASGNLASAFELNRESDAMRDRYGRNTTGQSLLLARRLVQTGVRVLQVNVGRVQTWDNHGNIFPTLKDRLLPPLDLGVSALLDDLESSGLLDETMVMMLGEFGRTPKINAQKGRDHWGPCFFGVFAGAGVQPGQLIGRSDETGAFPATRPFSPNDIGATVYRQLGIPLDLEVHDALGRPLRLNRGEVIESLFSGADA